MLNRLLISLVLVSATPEWGAATELVQSRTTVQQLDKCQEKIIDSYHWMQDDNQQWDLHLIDRNKAAELQIYGGQHSYDPEDPFYQRVMWNYFKSSVEIAFFEGEGVFKDGTLIEAIQSGTEPFFLQWLARKSGVPAVSWEMPTDQVFVALTRKFGADEILMFQTLREASFEKNKRAANVEQLNRRTAWYLERNIATMRKLEIQATIQTMDDLALRLKDLMPGVSWLDVSATWFTPFPSSNGEAELFHDINRFENSLRSRWAFRKVGAELLAGKKVFMTAGRNHVPLQKPAFECLFNEIDLVNSTNSNAIGRGKP